MWKYIGISLATIFVVWLWKVFCWVWLEPRRIEKILRKQGFKGNSYKLLFGDTKEIAALYEEAYSKPLGLHDDFTPRVMPFVLKTINTYAYVPYIPILGIFTGSAVTTALFSHPFNAQMQKCFDNLREISLMANIAVKTFDIPGKKYLPTQAHRKAMALEREVRETFTSMINERIRKRRAGILDGRDFFDMFLEDAYDENKAKELDVRSIVEDAVGNCKAFFFAGYETTSNLLVWTMVCLAIYPEWQTRARDEVFRVLGDRKELQPEDLSQLKIINMILLEVLRVYPPAIEISRIVEEETKLGNIVVPKGILLQLPIALLHRKPEIWGEDAGKFRPDRFSEGVLKASNGQPAYMPFGWGNRICIGQNFTMMEAKVFMAILLYSFTWELSPEYIHAPFCPFTVQPQHGAPLTLYEI